MRDDPRSRRRPTQLPPLSGEPPKLDLAGLQPVESLEQAPRPAAAEEKANSYIEGLRSPQPVPEASVARTAPHQPESGVAILLYALAAVAAIAGVIACAASWPDQFLAYSSPSVYSVAVSAAFTRF